MIYSGSVQIRLELLNTTDSFTKSAYALLRQWTKYERVRCSVFAVQALRAVKFCKSVRNLFDALMF